MGLLDGCGSSILVGSPSEIYVPICCPFQAYVTCSLFALSGPFIGMRLVVSSGMVWAAFLGVGGTFHWDASSVSLITFSSQSYAREDEVGCLTVCY
ncbi:hypothetical protein U1Q18_025723 [Sarracenia purpurea var. burkii]